jgi:hypothetical protein
MFLALCGGAIMLLSASLAARAQTEPAVSEVVVPQPDEVPAPQDHVMASQCMSEMRARYPGAHYDFFDIAFSHSERLGDIVRIRFDFPEVTRQGNQKLERVLSLVCLKRQPQASLETYAFAIEPPDANGMMGNLLLNVRP